MQSCWNITFAFLCHLAKGNKYERPCSRAIKFIPCDEQFLPGHFADVFVYFSSSASDLRSTMSASTELLPAERLLVISSHPGPCWDEEASVFRPYVDPQLISCLAAEAQAVLFTTWGYLAAPQRLLFGCSSPAAVSLSYLMCEPPHFSPSPRQKIASQIWKNTRSRASRWQSWRQFAWNGSEKAWGAVLAISAHSGIFTVKILPSVCTGGRIWLFQTASKQEFWRKRFGWITLKNVSSYLRTCAQILASDRQLEPIILTFPVKLLWLRTAVL